MRDTYMAGRDTAHARPYFIRLQRTSPWRLFELQVWQIRGLPPPPEFPDLCI